MRAASGPVTRNESLASRRTSTASRTLSLPVSEHEPDSQEVQAPPQAVIDELFCWYKGEVKVTAVRGLHMPKSDALGLCDPFLVFSLGDFSVKTKHERKTLSPNWNETISIPIADGTEMAKRYYAIHGCLLHGDATAGSRGGELTMKLLDEDVELRDWDVTGSELIGHVEVELYALLGRIAKPNAKGLEATFEVVSKSGKPVRGFDSKVTEILLRFRWEVDQVEADARAAAAASVRDRERREHLRLLLDAERSAKAKIREEQRARQEVARGAFLAQLATDAVAGGDAYACGSGSYGQHCLGETGDVGRARLVEGVESAAVQHLTAGDMHSIFVQEGGEAVLAGGFAQKGQLGLVEDVEDMSALVDDQLVPKPLQFWEDAEGETVEQPVVVQAVAGAQHSIFVCAEGRVFTCGDGSYGQLGFAAEEEALIPRHLDAFACKVKEAGAGAYHSVFLLEDGSVQACGSNHQGQLSMAAVEDDFDLQIAPRPMQGAPPDVVRVACGAAHTVLLDAQGQVWVCGSGAHGRLGTGSEENEGLLRRVEGLSRVEGVSCGEQHTLFLLEGGVVVGCGSNRFGQLGQAPRLTSRKGEEVAALPQHQRGLARLHAKADLLPLTPILGLGEEKAVAVAAGGKHSLVLTESGGCYSCGCNQTGQCGVESEEEVVAGLRRVEGFEGVKLVAIAAGAAHSLFLTSKLARRQRLIAISVVGKLRYKATTAAWEAWAGEVQEQKESDQWLLAAILPDNPPQGGRLGRRRSTVTGLRARSSGRRQVAVGKLSEAQQAAFTALRAVLWGLEAHVDDQDEAVRREAKQLFMVLDLDKNGVLSYMELHTALDSIGFVQEEIDLLLIRAGLSSEEDSAAEGINFEAFLEGVWPILAPGDESPKERMENMK